MKGRRGAPVRRAALVLLLWTGLGTATAGAADFPLFRGDLARTGRVFAGPEPPLELRWRFQTRRSAASIEAYPAADDGLSGASVAGDRVYVGGHDGYVYALDVATGKMLWEFPTRGRVGSTPALHGDRVFVGSSDGFLYALGTVDGSLAWKASSGRGTFRHLSYGGIRSSPAVALGLVFAGGCNGRVRALDEHTGALRWTLDGGTEGVYSSPALAGDTLFVGTDGLRQSALLAVDARTGDIVWRFPTSGQVFSTPAVAGGAVYFHARNDHVYALRAANGSLLWKTPAPSPQSEAAAFQDMAKSSPAVAEAAVYVGVDRELLALDRETGRILWRAPTQGRVDSSPLVVGSTVYVGSDDRSVYGLDASTGAVRWSYATGARVSISPSAAHGLLLIGSNDGSLYAFGPVGRSAPGAP